MSWQRLVLLTTTLPVVGAQFDEARVAADASHIGHAGDREPVHVVVQEIAPVVRSTTVSASLLPSSSTVPPA